MRYFARPQPEPPPEPVSDWQLRKAGFKIHARPNRGATMWERDGSTFTQAEAESIVRREKH